MRLLDPAPLTFDRDNSDLLSQNARLQFVGAHGEFFRIIVASNGETRVTMYPDGKPRLDRTWAYKSSYPVIAPKGLSREKHPKVYANYYTIPPYHIGITPDDFYITHFVPSDDLDDLDYGYLVTECWKLHVNLKTAALTWYDMQGRVFAADAPMGAYIYDADGRSVSHYMLHRPHEHYYGFGEVAGPLDKAGMRIRMSPRDALGYNAESTDPLYKHFPVYTTFVPTLDMSYRLEYDNFSETTFDLGKEIDYTKRVRYRYWRAEDGDIDYRIWNSLSPNAFQHVFRYAGSEAERFPIPAKIPDWAFGYLGSTMSYTEAPDAQEQLKKFADLCKQHDIPCDLFHLSSGYTTGDDGKRYVFTWNRSKIPDPKAMVDYFHDHGIRVAANVKPHLLKTHPFYDEVAGFGGFIRARDEGHPPAIAHFWSGGAGTTDEGSLLDFTNPQTFDWWKSKIKETLLAYGIDAIWNDNNEFQLPDDGAICDNFGDPVNLGQMRPIQTLLMARASYEALQAFYPDRVPYVITRSGGFGIQRYAGTWSGDNSTSWHTLKWNIPMGLSLSISGMPNTGHDIGGFYGDAPDPELFVRWVQNGVFHPRFCIHSWHADGSVNEPWMYPEVLPIIRDAIKRRYRLIPYFSSTMKYGQPLILPLVYHFPHDERTHTESFDFMCGRNLLVASIFEPGARERTVYLPTGATWRDAYTREVYQGGQTVTVPAPLNYIPVFLRDRADLPV
jgi:alpha-glucosidase